MFPFCWLGVGSIFTRFLSLNLSKKNSWKIRYSILISLALLGCVLQQYIIFMNPWHAFFQTHYVHLPQKMLTNVLF